MKNDKRKLKAQFEPEVGFEVETVHFRAAQSTELEQLKERLLRSVLKPGAGGEYNRLLRRAASDAASLAWDTGQPLLFFPCLFEETARLAVRQGRRQQEVRRRSAGLILEAA